MITDALVLSSIDHSIFVMNTEIQKEKFKFLEDITDKSKINSKAIILNGIKRSRLKYYYGKHGYGYGYGYGYDRYVVGKKKI